MSCVMKDGYFRVMLHGAFPIKVVKIEGHMILLKNKIPYMETSETAEIAYGEVGKSIQIFSSILI